MTLDQLLGSLAQDLNLPPFITNEKGEVVLSTNDNLALTISPYGKNCVLFKAHLRTLERPDDFSENDWRHFLRLSRSTLKKTLATITFDEETNTLFLYQTLSLNPIDGFKFRQSLENFLNDLEFWVKATKKESPVSNTEAPPAVFFP